MKEQFRKQIVKALPAVLAISIVLPVASFAGFFGDHPHYLHVLADLRYSRDLIQRPDAPNVVMDEENAVRELDLSINEIKQAARDDWKPLTAHPAVDTRLDRKGRLHEALKVMARAHNDICKEEDDRAARGLRNRAVGHLDQSMNFVRQAIGDKKMDEHL